MQRTITRLEIAGELENINLGSRFEGRNQISIGSGDCTVTAVQGEDGYWHILARGRRYETRAHFAYTLARTMGRWFNYLCWH